MPVIRDANGVELGEISLSEKQQGLLAAGAAVAVQYHTPQLMRGHLPQVSGSFNLQKVGDNIIADDHHKFAEYLAMLKAIEAHRNA